MQEITLNNQNYLLVETRKGYTCRISMHNDHLRCMEDTIGNSSRMNYIDLPEINEDQEYKLIGKISDILKDEDVCKGLILKIDFEHPIDSNKIVGSSYNDYTNDENFHNKATDSFQSYLRSINLDMSKQYLLIKKTI